MIKNSLTFAALLALTTNALATEQSLRPGGIAIIEIGKTDVAAPAVSMNNKPLLVMQRGEEWVAVAGIPLDTEPGNLVIVINGEESVRYRPPPSLSAEFVVITQLAMVFVPPNWSQ